MDAVGDETILLHARFEAREELDNVRMADGLEKLNERTNALEIVPRKPPTALLEPIVGIRLRTSVSRRKSRSPLRVH